MSPVHTVAKRKVSKRKGDPTVWIPSLRYGQPEVLGKSGVSLELAFDLYKGNVKRFEEICFGRLSTARQPCESGTAALLGPARRVGEQMRVRGDLTREAHHVGFKRLSFMHASAAHAAK